MTSQNLFACPDCGRECSFAALSCPNCGRPFPRPSSDSGSHPSDTLHTQILNQSTAKVGICLTLVGMLRIVEGVKQIGSIVDELLVATTLGFLVASFFSYFALKEAQAGKKQRLGKIGDRIFSISFLSLAVTCVVVVLESL